MLYEFRSRATGTVVMTADIAEPLLRAIGKLPGRTGIVTAAQLPAAIDSLERAVAASRQDLVAQRTDHPRVGATAGGKADHDLDRSFGKARLGKGGGCQDRQQASGAEKQGAAVDRH